MKKVLFVLLAIILVCPLTYTSINVNLIAALAEETDAEIPLEEEPPFVEETASESVTGLETIVNVYSEDIPKETQPFFNESQYYGSEELPYWISDVTYEQLMTEYTAASYTAMGDGGAGGRSPIIDATLVISSFGNGLESTIHINHRTLLSSGTNSPHYDNASGVLLTPHEGLPAAGTTSDRSMLMFMESTNGADIYEATFFFGSMRYPDAPFTAFRTYVVLESSEDQAEPSDSEDALPENTPVADVSLEDEKNVVNASAPPDTLSDFLKDSHQMPAIQPAPALQGLLTGTTLFSAADLVVGQQFTSTVGGVTWWNGSVSAGVFQMNFMWEGIWVSGYVACQDPNLPGPLGPSAINYVGMPVYLQIIAINKMAGQVTLSAFVPAPYPYASQRLYGSNFTVNVRFTGDIALIKTSASPDITNGNACYDLAGAQYGLYSNWSDAYNNSNRLHTFITASDGSSNRAYGLTYGTYFIKELVAPKGYQLDTAIYPVVLDSTLATITRADVPMGDPAAMIVQKLDTETGEAYGKDDPNGLLLAGAEFTVRYWDGYYDTVEEAEASGEPTRTWVFATEKNGVVNFYDEKLLKTGSDELFRSQYGTPTIPLGTVAISETKPATGYLLPDPNPISLQRIEVTGDPLQSVTRLNAVIVMEEPHEVVAEKLDSSTNEPISDTEFTLYQESSPGAGDWEVVSSHITDEFGKCVFSPVAVGSYKLDETRANPQYAELEESGDSAHYFEITPVSTEEVQVFKNDLIQVAIEVYKKTIPLTNTALDGAKDQAGNHVGLEEYLYRFGARSNSNVRVDEFVITDSLEFVTSKGYRMTTLWTGTAPIGMDYDGLMHILYRTNMTEPSETVSFSYNPMSANPYNANNPTNNMSVSVEPGWRIWQECVSTVTAIRLEVADLNLKEDEYITGLRAVYGGVREGFYTGASWGAGGNEAAADTQLAQLASFELRDWWYSVVATGSLLPFDEMGNETVMQGSIQADLFRNWGSDAPVLTDIDHDRVETRVIKTFAYDKKSLGIQPAGYLGSTGFPLTGDPIWFIVLGLIVFAVSGSTFISFAAFRQQKTKALESGDDE